MHGIHPEPYRPYPAPYLEYLNTSLDVSLSCDNGEVGPATEAKEHKKPQTPPKLQPVSIVSSLYHYYHIFGR